VTYARLEDSFRDHPRFIDMSCAAVGLWASSIAYCNKHLTDGRVPATALARLAPRETPKQRATIVGELVTAGAWHQNDDGSYQVHDYLDWNDPKARILAKREADRVRKESARNPTGRPTLVRADGATDSARSPHGPSRGPAGAGATDRPTKHTDPDPERAYARGPDPEPESARQPSTPAETAAVFRELAAQIQKKAMP